MNYLDGDIDRSTVRCFCDDPQHTMIKGGDDIVVAKLPRASQIRPGVAFA
jgi:hypothetical protein